MWNNEEAALWDLVKIEFAYSWKTYAIAWSFPLLLAIILLAADVQEAYLITWGTSVLPVIFFTVMYSVTVGQEKRIRIYTLLPYTREDIAAVQLVNYLIFIAGMMTVIFLVYLAAPTEPVYSALIRIVIFLGTILNWVLFFWVKEDIAKSGRKMYEFLFVFGGVAVIAAAAYIKLRFDISLLMWVGIHGSRPLPVSELVGTAVLALGLIAAEIKCFQMRKSFLE